MMCSFTFLILYVVEGFSFSSGSVSHVDVRYQISPFLSTIVPHLSSPNLLFISTPEFITGFGILTPFSLWAQHRPWKVTVIFLSLLCVLHILIIPSLSSSSSSVVVVAAAAVAVIVYLCSHVYFKHVCPYRIQAVNICIKEPARWVCFSASGIRDFCHIRLYGKWR